MYQIVKNRFAIMVSATVVVVLMTVAGISAYKTHVEKDSGLFFSTYPHLIGTRMDARRAIAEFLRFLREPQEAKRWR